MKGNSSCAGFTYLTAEEKGVTTIYFRDETQIFFMDSELPSLNGKVGASHWTSHIAAARAPPLSPNTTGLQIWIKDCGPMGLAFLLVNVGQETLRHYALPLSDLPVHGLSQATTSIHVRDIWARRDLPALHPNSSLVFDSVAAHDSAFLLVAAKRSAARGGGA